MLRRIFPYFLKNRSLHSRTTTVGAADRLKERELSHATRERNAIDVSEWQGRIDWTQVSRSGIRYSYIRACVGSSHVDSQFHRNYREAHRNGVRIGFYHYVTARSVEQARRQARFFARIIASHHYDMRPVLDFESFGRLNKEEVNRIALAYLRELEHRTHYRPAIYSDSNNAVNTFTDQQLTRYPLWVAAYGVQRPETGNWSSYSMWQYADDGRISGIRDDSVDLDNYRRGLLIRRRPGRRDI